MYKNKFSQCYIVLYDTYFMVHRSTFYIVETSIDLYKYMRKIKVYFL